MITPLYLESKASGPRLRVGVLIDREDSGRVPRYVATILEDIARCNFADVALAVVVQKAAATVAERLPRLAHDLYVRLDRAIGGDSDPLALVDAGPGLAGVDRVEVSPGDAVVRDPPPRTPADLWLPAPVLAEIARRDLDVILRFCTPVPRGEALRAARHGVWSYQFGAEEDARTGTPFLQQLVDGAPTRDVLLEVLEDVPAAGLVLCRSSFGSQGNLLLAHYRDVAFWETTHFVVWKLHDLHAFGWDHVRARAVPRVPRGGRPGGRPGAPADDRRDGPRALDQVRVPTTGGMVRFLAPRLGTAVAHRVLRQPEVSNQWRLGLRRGAKPFGSTRETTNLDAFRWIETAPGHFWADPFLFERGGQTVLFFEDYDYATGYATIRWSEVWDDCTIGPPVTCLDAGFHLSFPLVFEHDGEVFMIPESLADGTVTLYRARSFPSEWVPEKVLFRGNATDTSLVHMGGRFYFFTTLFDRSDRGMKTMLFVADALTGEWRLHPASPVATDVRDSRNAGAVLRRDGRLFRPTQNCGPTYGHGLNLDEIVVLDEDRYEERPWCAVGPEALPFPAVGVHTYNVCGDLEVIDGCAQLVTHQGPRRPLTPLSPPSARR